MKFNWFNSCSAQTCWELALKQSAERLRIYSVVYYTPLLRTNHVKRFSYERYWSFCIIRIRLSQILYVVYSDCSASLSNAWKGHKFGPVYFNFILTYWHWDVMMAQISVHMYHKYKEMYRHCHFLSIDISYRTTIRRSSRHNVEPLYSVFKIFEKDWYEYLCKAGQVPHLRMFLNQVKFWE